VTVCLNGPFEEEETNILYCIKESILVLDEILQMMMIITFLYKKMLNFDFENMRDNLEEHIIINYHDHPLKHDSFSRLITKNSE